MDVGMPFPLTMNLFGDHLYYFAFSRNLLCRMHTRTLRSEVVGPVPLPPQVGEERLYHHGQIHGGWLWLAPFHADHVARYHLTENRWQVWPLSLREELTVPGQGKFYQIIPFEDKVFLLPFTYGAVVALDLDTGETEHCLDIWKLFDDYVASDVYQSASWYMNRVFFHQYEHLTASRILMPSIHANVMLEFDMRNHAHRVHRIGASDRKLCAVTRQEGSFLIAAMNYPEIHRWRPDRGVEETITAFPDGFGKSLPSNRDLIWGRNECVTVGTYWYLFPARGNMVLRMNLETSAIERLPEFDPYCRPLNEDDISYFDGSCTDGRFIWLWHKSFVLLRYDTKKRIITECGSLFDFADEKGENIP